MGKNKICINGHSFKDKFPLSFCPECKESLEYVYDIDVYLEKLKRHLTKKEINGRNLRNKLSDSLPRVPWFNDIENEENQDRRNELWSDEEIYVIKEHYQRIGLANAKMWKKVAENVLERSLFGLEHHLRLVICEMELGDYYFQEHNSFFK